MIVETERPRLDMRLQSACRRRLWALAGLFLVMTALCFLPVDGSGFVFTRGIHIVARRFESSMPDDWYDVLSPATVQLVIVALGSACVIAFLLAQTRSPSGLLRLVVPLVAACTVTWVLVQIYWVQRGRSLRHVLPWVLLVIPPCVYLLFVTGFGSKARQALASLLCASVLSLTVFLSPGLKPKYLLQLGIPLALVAAGISLWCLIRTRNMGDGEARDQAI